MADKKIKKRTVRVYVELQVPAGVNDTNIRLLAFEEMKQRINSLAANTPELAWDGVEVMPLPEVNK